MKIGSRTERVLQTQRGVKPDVIARRITLRLRQPHTRFLQRPFAVKHVQYRRLAAFQERFVRQRECFLIQLHHSGRGRSGPARCRQRNQRTFNLIDRGKNGRFPADQCFVHSGFGELFGRRVGSFTERAGEIIAGELDASPEMRLVAETLMKARASILYQIKVLDRRLCAVARATPVVRLFMTATGVGVITALSVASVFDDASRLKRSSSEGAYLGLTPRRYESGETSRNGRISKQDNQLQWGKANVYWLVAHRGDLRDSHFLATHMMQAVPIAALITVRARIGVFAPYSVMVLAALWAVSTLAEFSVALSGQHTLTLALHPKF